MLTDVEGAILRLTMIKDLFDDLSVNSNCVSVLLNREDELALKTAIEALKEQRPHGERIVRRNKQRAHIYSVCSKCNMPYLDTDFPNFCPNCGASMRKEGEENG